MSLLKFQCYTTDSVSLWLQGDNRDHFLWHLFRVSIAAVLWYHTSWASSKMFLNSFQSLTVIPTESYYSLHSIQLSSFERVVVHCWQGTTSVTEQKHCSDCVFQLPKCSVCLTQHVTLLVNCVCVPEISRFWDQNSMKHLFLHDDRLSHAPHEN